MSGWIKLQRDIMDHWVAQDPEYLSVWIRMLSEANFESKTKMFNGQVITVERGQFVFGLDSYSEKTKVSTMRLRRLIDLLEKHKMINRVKFAKYSVISIVNYDKYQSDNRVASGSEQAQNSQPTGKQQAQNNTIRSKELQEGKEVKKNNSKQLDFSEWPCMASGEVFNDWVSLRKSKKATISQTVINQIGKELTKAVNQGWTVDGALSEAIAAGWQGFKADWLITRSAGGKQASSNINQIANAAKEYLNERQ